MTRRKTIFLVEDDLELAQLTRDRLENEGFQVSHEADGKEACPRILKENPDLLILDLMLPGLDGFGVCRNIRPAYKGPILILTARDSDLDQILGLEIGADDFVIKPIRPQVLLARIKALLRRTDQIENLQASGPITVGNLTVEPSRREVSHQESPLELTTVEFDLLWYLVRNAGSVQSKD